ncbi:MAG TPA: BON domain-containing protein [Gemmatimonadales bacterium]|nr:BON domain-containing protein [Gemmatimonadales bacterium]
MIDPGGGSAIELWRAEDEADVLAAELQHDVWDELRAEPALEGCLADLAVYVTGREVTLIGAVRRYPQKATAGRAASRVPGAARLVNSIRVEILPLERRADHIIAEEVQRVLGWDTTIPPDRILVSVREGRVTLRGEVDREHQRTAAEQAVEPLIGITALRNEIAVRPMFVTGNLQPQVVAAIRRLRAQHVRVETHGGTVSLHGRVASLADRESIDRAVREIPGVVMVEDGLTIER